MFLSKSKRFFIDLVSANMHMQLMHYFWKPCLDFDGLELPVAFSKGVYEPLVLGSDVECDSESSFLTHKDLV
jgi:hypothetical protein